MCGIAGLWTTRDSLDVRFTAAAMTACLAHRGPDAEGVWADEQARVALGHRRLSIIDLSPAGAQPMASPGGRFVVSFNGEIYNYRDLRPDLPVVGDAGDTAVLAAALETWGIEATLSKLVGMFAFAAWDRRERRLHLARDHVGIKPLYYGFSNGVFAFASELKSLRQIDGFDLTIDRQSLASFMRFSYVPAPHSIYENVHKLEPGTFATLAGPTRDQCTHQTYWSLPTIAEQGQAEPFTGSDDEAIDELDRLLRQSIDQQSIADVPLGAFLSGGVDSSTVVALMQAREGGGRTKTFTIGSADARYDESSDAAAVARHLGTDHTEWKVTAAEAQAVIPKLPTIYDEPFGDYSQIPTFLVSQLARRHVTVALSGDGGDELFAGYNRHVWASGLWNKARRVPRPLRRLAATAATSLSPSTWDKLLGGRGHRHPGQKLHKLATFAAAPDAHAAYRTLLSQWQDPASLVLGINEEAPSSEPNRVATQRRSDETGIDLSPPRPALRSNAAWFGGGLTNHMLLSDALGYLPDDILHKVDRASMGVSLEARVPLLDHRVIEFAWTLPLNMKLRDGIGKWPLRQLLYRHVPQRLIDRPKSGFGVPLDAWLRGPLRDWASDLLTAPALADYLDTALVQKTWRRFLAGRAADEQKVWNVLMFSAWQKAEEARS